MKMKEGYKIIFSIVDWDTVFGEAYEIDNEILDVYMQFGELGEEDFFEKGLHLCTEKDFNKTPYERDLWEVLESTKRYCMDLNDTEFAEFELYGNIDSYMREENATVL